VGNRVIRNPLVGIASYLWSSLNFYIRIVYKLGLLPKQHLGVRTISVGNIQAGGSGKTPIVMDIVRRALGHRLRPLVLSRGYGGQWERSGGVLIGLEKSFSPRECGDEPYLIKSSYPDVVVGVCGDRLKSFKLAEAERKKCNLPPFDLVILDDGLQQFSILRDRNISTYTGISPYQTVYRDYASTLLDVDAWVNTRSASRRPMRCGQFFSTKRKLKPWGLSLGSHKAVILVAGIGDPETFASDVRELGFQVHEHYFYPDHFDYPESELHRHLERARALDLKIGTTRKDFVKWDIPENDKARVIVFDLELEFVSLDGRGQSKSQEEEWERFLFQK